MIAEKFSIEVLVQQIDSQISRLEFNRDRDKRKSKRVAVLSASGTGMATLLLGLSKFYESAEVILQSGSLFLGSVTTVLLAWDNHFNHKKLWVISAQTVRELFYLKDDIEHSTHLGELSDERLAKFFTEYREIMKRGDKKWDKLRAI